jgi:hypothetical protein
MQLRIISCSSNVEMYPDQLTPRTKGIGVTVVRKSATQFMIPHMRVMTPSSMQVSAGAPMVQ